MRARGVILAAIAMPLLLIVACESYPPATPTATPTAAQKWYMTATATAPTSVPSLNEDYLEEAIPPCTPLSGSSVDPCGSDAIVEQGSPSSIGSAPIRNRESPRSVRTLFGYAVSFTPHIVIRATYLDDTARCTINNIDRPPPYSKPGFLSYSNLLQCFVDVRVNEYILGEGPSKLTVQNIFLHYYPGEFAPSIVNKNRTKKYATEEEFLLSLADAYEKVIAEGPELSGNGIYGREVVLAIGPPHSFNMVVWEVFNVWDVQTQEDGTAIVVHPLRDAWKGARPDDYQKYKATLEQTLPDFERNVIAAHQARLQENGGAIASVDDDGVAEGVTLPLFLTDIHNLAGWMANIGAYDHPEGTPVPPPPVPGEGDPGPGDIGVDG